MVWRPFEVVFGDVQADVFEVRGGFCRPADFHLDF
jgi:hypothetical protein